MWDGEDDTTKCTHCGGGEVSRLLSLSLSHFKVRVRLLSLFHGALYTRLGTVRGRHPRTGRTYVHFMSTFRPLLFPVLRSDLLAHLIIRFVHIIYVQQIVGK